MKDLFAQFLKEKQFLNGVSPKTIRSYQQAFNAYQRVLSKTTVYRANREGTETPLNKNTLKRLYYRNERIRVKSWGL